VVPPSAGASWLTLMFVRHVRDLDRYRYLTLTGGDRTAAAAARSPRRQGEWRRATVGRRRPLSFQPVEIAKILLAFFFASYFAANRELLSTPTQRVGPQTSCPQGPVPIVFAWGLSVAILGAENDIGFAMLLFAFFISLLWVTTGLKTYVVLRARSLRRWRVHRRKLLLPSALSRQRLAQPLVGLSTSAAHLVQLAYGWFSFAAGGITGTGLGLGQSGNIPFITSDMIFAAVGRRARVPRRHPGALSLRRLRG
jgi:cell division protein FtsW (lipid II flippase)